MSIVQAQSQLLHGGRGYSKADTLRGSLSPERNWWDVQRYDIAVEPDFNTKTIKGSATITFKVIAINKNMQIDLQEPMELTEALWNNTNLPFTREGNVYHLAFPSAPAVQAVEKLQLQFSGKPREAIRPPWDGGWIWKKDNKGNPWMSVACQGLGASVWYPCKDHQSDEPDNGASLAITVPDTLTGVGNGRLKSKQKNSNRTTTYTWEVKNAINAYNIVPYIGKYVNFEQEYEGTKGTLDCSYWVLPGNLSKAKTQFAQVRPMLKCFEHWFGPYPFYEDSYKLVESPHLGMEHQSAIAYGNQYKNGYLGTDKSSTGWGLKWDFIIIHESGHEWFANNITSNDIADMWIHESFTTYAETLYAECQYNKKAGEDYVIGTRANIKNDVPIIGPYGVNQEGSVDMYNKGANMLHTIRHVVHRDSLFREMLRGLNKTFYHKTVSTQQVEAYMSQQLGINLSKIFDQYLRTTQIPTLEYSIRDNQLFYTWTNCVEGFNMPVKISVDGGQTWSFIKPVAQKQLAMSIGNKNVVDCKVDRNFYVNVKAR